MEPRKFQRFSCGDLERAQFRKPTIGDQFKFSQLFTIVIDNLTTPELNSQETAKCVLKLVPIGSITPNPFN